jgi:hypothetical protein
MAKISAEFDTVAKTLEVKLDGKPVSNVNEVRLSKSYMEEGEFCASIVTMTEDEEHDTRMYTQLMARESIEGKDAFQKSLATESKDFPDFLVASPLTKAQEDIASFFAKG